MRNSIKHKLPNKYLKELENSVPQSADFRRLGLHIEEATAMRRKTEMRELVDFITDAPFAYRIHLNVCEITEANAKRTYLLHACMDDGSHSTSLYQFLLRDPDLSDLVAHAVGDLAGLCMMVAREGESRVTWQ